MKRSSYEQKETFKLKGHTSECVKELFDSLEKKLGKELFAIGFPLILTDNGHEFSDIDGLENSLFGGKRTRIFFCEPNRSDQKITILPKGAYFKSLTAYDALLITNHINSYAK